VSDIVFRADSITRSFGQRRVLTAATLWARRGSIAALLGRNGCGKSTLLRVAAGLLAADQGVILFDGRVHARPRLHQLANDGLFLLPERGLLPRTDALRTLLRMVADRFGTYNLLDDVIDRLRVGDLLDRTADTFSGGECRRAEVAIALTRAPRVLLADEPFMGIAPKDIDTIASALRQLAQDGCAIVASGHEVEALLELADEVVWMTAGTTHSLGSPAAARAHWQFRHEYLGRSPQTGRRPA
jgi:ABC-type multidrug transport system ATPase subunit